MGIFNKKKDKPVDGIKRGYGTDQAGVNKDNVPEAISLANFSALISLHPDIKEKLEKAFRSQRFFITISYQAVEDPAKPQNDLQHFWKQVGFPKGDVLLSLRHLANDWNKKHNPKAAAKKEGEWF